MKQSESVQLTSVSVVQEVKSLLPITSEAESDTLASNVSTL